MWVPFHDFDSDVESFNLEDLLRLKTVDYSTLVENPAYFDHVGNLQHDLLWPFHQRHDHQVTWWDIIKKKLQTMFLLRPIHTMGDMMWHCMMQENWVEVISTSSPFGWATFCCLDRMTYQTLEYRREIHVSYSVKGVATSLSCGHIISCCSTSYIVLYHIISCRVLLCTVWEA